MTSAVGQLAWPERMILHYDGLWCQLPPLSFVVETDNLRSASQLVLPTVNHSAS